MLSVLGIFHLAMSCRPEEVSNREVQIPMWRRHTLGVYDTLCCSEGVCASRVIPKVPDFDFCGLNCSLVLWYQQKFLAWSFRSSFSVAITLSCISSPVPGIWRVSLGEPRKPPFKLCWILAYCVLNALTLAKTNELFVAVYIQTCFKSHTILPTQRHLPITFDSTRRQGLLGMEMWNVSDEKPHSHWMPYVEQSARRNYGIFLDMNAFECIFISFQLDLNIITAWLGEALYRSKGYGPRFLIG